MERIQAAIQKAKQQRSGQIPPQGPAALGAGATRPASRRGVATEPGPAWAEIQPFEPDPRLMERNRVVTFADQDPTHSTFDMLRTRVLRTMRANGWVSLGITSPTSGCGKTTTSLNLAFSLAHQPDVRAVLVDLDLRRPALARNIGLTVPQSMASVLLGTRPVAENFVRYGGNLAIGTNAQSIRETAELLMSAATAGGVASLKAAFRPDIIIYDLPPMLQSDDAMAFLPHLDCVLLVAGAEKSRLDEVDKCEHDLAQQTNVLGIVLNMCRYTGEEYGYY
ncbi:MAG TPA: CpsD/CapB family tyrosine-protein kinase [Gemmatimonadales bacterium]|nr:CpsD/CapB family tyrosine-protein kinase [Gemmatimonadales bacterium]